MYIHFVALLKIISDEKREWLRIKETSETALAVRALDNLTRTLYELKRQRQLREQSKEEYGVKEKYAPMLLRAIISTLYLLRTGQKRTAMLRLMRAREKALGIKIPESLSDKVPRLVSSSDGT